MKNLFVIAVLASALAACGGKKGTPATTPNNSGSMTAPTGGATYGAPAGGTATPDPCSAKGTDPCTGN